jgi:hypothetical protein
MACVSICERETLAIHHPTDRSCSTEINTLTDVHDCDGCPLSLPKAASPERTKSFHALASSAGFIFVLPSVYLAQPDLLTPMSNGSPPLKALASLRI